MSVGENVARPQVRVRVRRSTYEVLKAWAERDDQTIASYAGQMLTREVERRLALQKRKSA